MIKDKYLSDYLFPYALSVDLNRLAMPKQGVRNPEAQVVQDGKWELQNLKFIGEFMEVNGLSTTMIAEKLGISRQSVYYWLKKDDAMISNIYGLFDAYGLKIRFELKEEGTEESPMKIPGVGIAVKKPRIGFFESFIKRKGIKREQVAEVFGVKKCTVDHWFQFDDCFFSYICRFAQLNNLEVKYTVSHKND